MTLWMIHLSSFPSFWSDKYGMWADTDDGAALYQTEKEAEGRAVEVVMLAPDQLVGCVSVVPAPNYLTVETDSRTGEKYTVWGKDRVLNFVDRT